MAGLRQIGALMVQVRMRGGDMLATASKRFDLATRSYSGPKLGSGHFIGHNRHFGASRSGSRHGRFALDQRCSIVAGRFEPVAVRYLFVGPRFHAVAAEDAAVVID